MYIVQRDREGEGERGEGVSEGEREREGEGARDDAPPALYSIAKARFFCLGSGSKSLGLQEMSRVVGLASVVF